MTGRGTGMADIASRVIDTRFERWQILLVTSNDAV
jgi:hypothetical protein